MKNDRVYIGKLDTIIELIQFGSGRDATGGVIEQKTILGKLHANRVPGTVGSEENDGKIRWLNVRSYIIRHIDQVLTNGTNMAIRDADGDFDIHHVAPVGKKHWLLLKCSKRE